MKSKHDIMNKCDYMKAYSFNFILSEKTNTELEHQNNVGKIDKAFYQNFSWQISGIKPKQNTSQSHEEATQKTQSAQSQSTRLEDKLTKNENFTNETFTKVSRTDYSGATPKRYTTKCFFKTLPVPIWYTESLFLKVGSTKKSYQEKVYFKNNLHPYSWSESMVTEVNASPSQVYTTKKILPVEHSGSHYMSLVPQQPIVLN